MKHITPAVLAIIRNKNKYLITKRIDKNKRAHGLWQLPGGGIEFGEDPETAMIREVREEVGIELRNIRLIPYVYSVTRGSYWHGMFISFLSEPKEEEPDIVLNEEASEFRWVELGDLINLQYLGGTKILIEQAEKMY